MQQDQFPFARQGRLPIVAPFRTTILRNGPDALARPGDDLGALLTLLHTHPLNAVYAPFMVQSEVTADHHFFGNFCGIAHPFLIETNDPAVIERLNLAIRENQERDGGSAPIR